MRTNWLKQSRLNQLAIAATYWILDFSWEDRTVGSSDRDTHTAQPSGPLEFASDHGDYIKAVEHVRERAAAEHAKLSDRLPMWVVFGPGTSDQSGLFVARLWLNIPKPMSTDLL